MISNYQAKYFLNQLQIRLIINGENFAATKDIPKKGPIDHEMSKTLIHAYYASVSYVDAQIEELLNALDSFGLRDSTIVVLVGDHGWSLSEHGLWAKHSNFEVALCSDDY